MSKIWRDSFFGMKVIHLTDIQNIKRNLRTSESLLSLFLLPDVAVCIHFEVVFILDYCLFFRPLHFSLFLSSSTLLLWQGGQIDWHHEDAPRFFVSDVDCRSIRPDQHHRVQSLISLPATAHHRRPVGVELRGLNVEQWGLTEARRGARTERGHRQETCSGEQRTNPPGPPWDRLNME